MSGAAVQSARLTRRGIPRSAGCIRVTRSDVEEGAAGLRVLAKPFQRHTKAHHRVRRARDESDRRSVFVQRTVKGAVFLSEFADLIAEAGRDIA